MTDYREAKQAAPRIRASHAERQFVMDRIADAFAEGRLLLAEFEERTTIAAGAVFRDELTHLVDDCGGLPAWPNDTANGEVTGHQVDVPGHTAQLSNLPAARTPETTAVVPALVQSPKWVVLSSTTEHIATAPGGCHRTITVFADSTLDTREYFRSGNHDLEINLHVVFGDCKIIVPPGITVESATQVIFGNVASRVKPPRKKMMQRALPAPKHGVLRLTGRVIFANVKLQEG
ncbi:DUF1707 domain-containing protein [Corynebacterium choanae]|uniref:DUF1707 domain-containing protein n=1 Tax=Corynebacterium choanae TaxID=1862358 RepID=A0A3G6J463_9CORY|nr:DUF1707 domain-containing protein [Corynebacterium choanae]AZA12736.1 hypothetical protein CCHOA_01540 [Corynebacterium choanae]